MNIEYIIELSNKKSIYYGIDIDRKHDIIILKSKPSDWTDLDHHKCPVCTLDSAKHRYCPAALDIKDILTVFSKIKSYELVKVTVNTNERTYFKECDAQTALGSILGVVLASSQCPILSKFKPMAYFHLPFPSYEESLTRTMGFFLINEHIKSLKGEKPDIELNGLYQHYKDMEQINFSLKKRISKTGIEDSNINSIVNFFALSSLIKDSISEQIEDIKQFFE